MQKRQMDVKSLTKYSDINESIQSILAEHCPELKEHMENDEKLFHLINYAHVTSDDFILKGIMKVIVELLLYCQNS